VFLLPVTSRSILPFNFVRRDPAVVDAGAALLVVGIWAHQLAAPP
jgi:hypothetical protein